jgi:uncharacterized membrane protein
VPFSIRNAWERLRSHILFIPAALALLGIALAVTMVEIDRRIDPEMIRGIPWIFRAGASGARDLLATVAMSMVQLAAITFSVTIVALALRSQQFGPRLLRDFTADQVNQGILGAFIGTFVYSLLVLRAVRDLEDNAEIEAERFVPLLAVTAAILLALLSLALFVIFIDRVVSSIQANSIIAHVAQDTRNAIDRLFPDPLGEGEAFDEEDEAEQVYQPLEDAVEIMAPKTGYIQTLDGDRLMQAAREADLVLRMEAPIGGFVIEGTPLVTATPRERVDKNLVSAVQRAYRIGRNRSVTDDPEFGIRQIVDVAVKALSPSDNDPTTACTATEYLGALLIDFATRSLPSRLRRDEDGKLRVIALGPTFRRMANLAFNQIREHGADDVAATMQLLDTLIRVAAAVRGESRRRVLEEHAWKASRSAARNIRDPIDREAVNQRLQLVMERLGREAAGGQQYLIPLRTTSA